MLPRLLRFNLEELHETALLLNLQKKYGIDVDLLDHMVQDLLSIYLSTDLNTNKTFVCVVNNQEAAVRR